MDGYIFISYAHENSRFVKKLTQRLRQQALEVWLDQEEIGPEAAWNGEIEKALMGCHYFFLILSPAAINSWLVREQYLLASDNDKIIVPILHQPCLIPAELKHIPLIDFTKQDDEQALREIFRAHFPENSRPVGEKPTFGMFWQRLNRKILPQSASFSLPGWLGPSILVMTLFISTFFLWPSEADELTRFNVSEVSAPISDETLAVIPTATPLPFVRSIDGKPMAFVPAGEFLMGSNEADPLASDDEKPQRRVYLDAFWIDQTEITNRDYQKCVVAGQCTPQYFLGRTFMGDTYPVVGVDWFQSEAYCEWAGGRLPTEAEWEKAARGTDGQIYPWGNQFDGSRLNSCDRNCIQDWRDSRADDGYKYTAPIGSYPNGASPYGVFDMSGNVWEWTADWYGEDYYQMAPLENPKGPAFGQQRVIRGGSWHYSGRNLRAVNRHKDIPTFQYDKIGFRCVVEDAAGLEHHSN